MRDKVISVALAASLALLAPASAPAETKKAAVAAEGKTVKVHYTLKVDGKVVDTSKERGPLEFKAGAKQMIPGFEKNVIGMKPGQKKSFSVKPEDGYGNTKPEAIREIPRKDLPPDVKPGVTLYAKMQNGQSVPVKVLELKKETAVMDFNHPLAGKTLNFEVEVLEVK